MPCCNVVVRTYPFDPEAAHDCIQAWVAELSPSVVVGESLGGIHALGLEDMPVVLVSPALGAAGYLRAAAPLCRIPFIRSILERRYKPKEGRRQIVSFEPSWLRKWPPFKKAAISARHPYVFAFFGKKDKFRRSGVVNIKEYRRHFGNACDIYDGSHWMEEEYVISMLVPRISELLAGNTGR